MSEINISRIHELLKELWEELYGEEVQPTEMKRILKEKFSGESLGIVWVKPGLKEGRGVIGLRTVGDPTSKEYLITVSHCFGGINVHYCNQSH